ncbi:hypothetical protein Fleli_2564 [Bernardetia litoralis DSM 6794]|uniref:SiaC family regulatory phosphoprotein domain-containing protein n=1 Tax=Bernardetia litoralis (strain ATCC 23117 / DSM 6794 / NBRC 15988 / NCIMB 1366 / Fx l1 / Sio-4) TaxID=880071 RepID=I4ALU3_BERLS|nr:hypothetical protein [Bernardetia litoralis]AFM04928.1 hypothetical protein Fleli_2564 [Bernardetia litoralis DSM 6794]
MAYQLDLEKGFLELNLSYKNEDEFIEEHDEIFDKIQMLNTIHFTKFEIKIDGVDDAIKNVEDILFLLLVNILSEIEIVSKNKFPVTVFWYYKNDKELETGNEMNDVLDKHMKFEFIKIN